MSQEAHNEPPREYSLFAAFLSYLVPGMGQIYSGRIGKGVLFLVCLYGMFFYGMWLSDWSNVYLPRLGPITVFGKEIDEPMASIAHRPQFAGQFWIGIAAWPAIWQYYHFNDENQVGPLLGNYQRTPNWERLNELQRNGSKIWDLAWVYTVIAGVLNVLVIYDAFAGPAFLPGEQREEATVPEVTSV
jgi:hypothetical protein